MGEKKQNRKKTEIKRKKEKRKKMFIKFGYKSILTNLYDVCIVVFVWTI